MTLSPPHPPLRLHMRIVGILIAAASLALTGCQDSPRSAPRLELPALEFDLGEALPGVELHATFPIRNQGGRPLVIEQVRVGCGLLARIEPASTLAPGEDGRIVIWQTAGAGRGEQLQTATVYSNDPERPAVTLRLRSRLTADLAAKPAQWYVGELRRSQEAPLPLRLLSQPGISARRLEIEGDVLEGWLDSRDGQQQIRARARADAPAGPFRDAIIVHGAAAPLRIPVVGIIEAGAS